MEKSGGGNWKGDTLNEGSSRGGKKKKRKETKKKKRK